MDEYVYCSYYIERRRLLKEMKNGKKVVWEIAWDTKHGKTWVLTVRDVDLKELMLRWLNKWEKVEKEWKEKERIIYYGRWWYIDKIIWWEKIRSEREDGWIHITGSVNIVNEEVKNIIEEELWEKVKEELEFLPIVLKWQYWVDAPKYCKEKVWWDDIWWEVEVEKWWEVRWYYIINVLNKIYSKELENNIKWLKWDLNKIEKELKKMYEWKIFVDYILNNVYLPEWEVTIDGRVHIKKELMKKIDEKIKPKIYKIKCDDLVKRRLNWIN